MLLLFCDWYTSFFSEFLFSFFLHNHCDEKLLLFFPSFLLKFYYYFAIGTLPSFLNFFLFFLHKHCDEKLLLFFPLNFLNINIQVIFLFLPRIFGVTSRICETANYETATSKDDPMYHLLSIPNNNFPHKVYLKILHDSHTKHRLYFEGCKALFSCNIGSVLRLFVCLFVFGSDSPPLGQGPLIHEVSRSHTTTHHSRQDSSGRVISSHQRPLPDNTRHSQQTNIHARGGIRTHNLSRRAAVDLRLRPCGHWDRLVCYVR